jgi:hypothetical protein
MGAGYTPDPFGHIATLPAILAGFDLDNAIFERGLGDEVDRLGSEFLWRAPDGTEILAIRLLATYSALAALGHRDFGQSGRPDPRLAAGQAARPVQPYPCVAEPELGPHVGPAGLVQATT